MSESPDSAVVHITDSMLRSFLDEIRSREGVAEARSAPRRPTCVECGAFLSRYNPSETHCAVHEPPSYRIPDRR
jgi:hypothetical protein